MDEDLESEIATKLSEIFGTNRTIESTPERTRVRRDKPIHNQKHRRNKKISNSNLPQTGRPSAMDGNRKENEGLIRYNHQEVTSDETPTQHTNDGCSRMDNSKRWS